MHQKRKRPNSSSQESDREPKQKFYRSHLNKFKQNIPPRYDRKFDREILEGFANKYRGSLIGQVVSQWLREHRQNGGQYESA